MVDLPVDGAIPVPHQCHINIYRMRQFVESDFKNQEIKGIKEINEIKEIKKLYSHL